MAVIQTGGKQYCVKNGDVLEVEKLEGEVGTEVMLDVLMSGSGESIVTGKAAAAKQAKAKILAQERAKKVVVFKYKAKKNVRRKHGHRQYFTRIQILSVD